MHNPVPTPIASASRVPSRRRRTAVATPVYGGTFGESQAERLLWRAGFGPRPGELAAVAGKGLRGAVLSLTRPAAARLSGPAPTDGEGRPIAPADAWGHDHLWWLDRMVRTNQPLVERMTLNWHDWFATGDVGSSRLGLAQNALMRRNALGSFATLLEAVTRDPAMLIWLSGTANRKDSPNENYARELMELFTLGAGRGYSEDDVREMARALTGFVNRWGDTGPYGFRFDPAAHDAGVKRVLGRRGRFDWHDACRLCLEHRSHASFFVDKLWSYFMPVPPPPSTRTRLVRLYKANRYAVRPVVEAILMHPLFYEGPRMVKPPIVYIAGLLRTRDAGVHSDAFAWTAALSGQMLFHPPNVAGWDEARWLDTATWRGRWKAANLSLERDALKPDSGDYDAAETPAQAVEHALAFWGRPSITPETAQRLTTFAERCAAVTDQRWKQISHRILRQNALRMLVATSPDLQTC